MCLFFFIHFGTTFCTKSLFKKNLVFFFLISFGIFRSFILKYSFMSQTACCAPSFHVNFRLKKTKKKQIFRLQIHRSLVPKLTKKKTIFNEPNEKKSTKNATSRVNFVHLFSIIYICLLFFCLSIGVLIYSNVQYSRRQIIDTFRFCCAQPVHIDTVNSDLREIVHLIFTNSNVLPLFHVIYSW